MGKGIIQIKQTSSGGGGGTIGGSIAVNQVAVGTGVNTIEGSPQFLFNRILGILIVTDSLGNVLFTLNKSVGQYAIGDINASNNGNYFIISDTGNLAALRNTTDNILFGINTSSPSTTLHVNGSATFKIKAIAHSDSPYTVLYDDFTILCDTAAGDIEVKLPVAGSFNGRILNIKNIGVNANTMTITPASLDEIDGEASASTTTPYTNYQIQASDSQSMWYIL